MIVSSLLPLMNGKKKWKVRRGGLRKWGGVEKVGGGGWERERRKEKGERRKEKRERKREKSDFFFLFY